ncbi:YciI family protein [Streptomyces sp. NPDC005408]|uniref:YciI family protein n=1 Tax=Streptomyces sp. NPDC005408 TaxID=3155341 RepID=UPI0033A7D441
MEFALLVCGEEKAWDDMPESERRERFEANLRYGRELHEAGVVIRYGAKLARPDVAAKGERAQDGRPEVGGLWILELDSEEAALEWAARMPVSPGNVVDVRRCDRPGATRSD